MAEIQGLLVEGKGKRLYKTDIPDQAILYFKDEAKAYHGLKRGRIIGKGEINNAICAHLFTLLRENGVDSHFIQKLDARQSLVNVVEIIPVSVVVRNRVAGNLAKRIGYPIGTSLKEPVVEYHLKDEELENPLVNHTHIRAMNLATREETEQLRKTALRVNEILSAYMREIQVELIDFRLEFGRYDGRVILADEITPDVARFWDAATHEPMDLDRFRRDMGEVEENYQELLKRMIGTEYPGL